MRIEVNGARVDPELIRAEAAILRRNARELGHEVTPEDGSRFWKQASRIAIEETILRQEAARCGLAFEQLFELWCESIRPPRPREVRNYYMDNEETFWTPLSILVSHIFRNVHHEDERERRLAEIKQVREVLETGAGFAETADHFSDCPGNGGRIGYIQHGEMVPEFDDIVFNSQVGQITPIFPTRFGFHIALVAEILPEGIPPFKKIAPAVESALMERKRTAAIASRIEQLWARASIREVSGA